MNQIIVKATPARAQTAHARPLWKRAALAARVQSERALHPWRRRRARQHVRALRGARSVLFVCHGNIYRSPFAAACFAGMAERLGNLGLRIGSAGFTGPNRSCPADAQQLAQQMGVDLSAHRSQLVNGSMLGDWDVIVVMSAQQARLLSEHYGVAPGRVLLLGDLDPESVTGREIADPWSAPALILKGSYARVERCVRVLAELALSWGSAGDSGAGSTSTP